MLASFMMNKEIVLSWKIENGRVGGESSCQDCGHFPAAALSSQFESSSSFDFFFVLSTVNPILYQKDV